MKAFRQLALACVTIATLVGHATAQAQSIHVDGPARCVTAAAVEESLDIESRALLQHARVVITVLEEDARVHVMLVIDDFVRELDLENCDNALRAVSIVTSLALSRANMERLQNDRPEPEASTSLRVAPSRPVPHAFDEGHSNENVQFSRHESLEPIFRVDGGVGILFMPTASARAHAAIGLRRGSWRFELGFAGTTRSDWSGVEPGAAASYSVYSGDAHLSAELWRDGSISLRSGVGIELGVMAASATGVRVDNARSESAPWIASVGAFAVEVDVLSWLSFVAQVDAGVVLVRPRFEIGGIATPFVPTAVITPSIGVLAFFS